MTRVNKSRGRKMGLKPVEHESISIGMPQQPKPIVIVASKPVGEVIVMPAPKPKKKAKKKKGFKPTRKAKKTRK